MRNRLVILIAAASMSLFAASSMNAASFQMVAQPKTSSQATTWKGAGIGIVGATAAPVAGLPCFCFQASILFPLPTTGLVSGQPFQAFFTLQTAGFSGTADVSLKMYQNGNVIYELSGALDFSDGTVYAVWTNDAVVPSSPGPAELVINVTQGSVVFKNFNRVVII